MTDEQTVRHQVMGQRVQARREHAGWSQRDLAAQIDVSQATVQKWEAGVAVPRWPAMWALAEALGVSARWLVEPLVVDIGEVQTGEDEHDPGASADTTLQRKTEGSHASEATLGVMASGMGVSTNGLHSLMRGEQVPSTAKPTVRSNEERIDRLERQTDLVMDLLHRLHRELRGQRRELREQRR